MNRQTLLLSFALVGLMALRPGPASAAPARSLSLAQAIALGQKGSPDIASGRASVQVAIHKRKASVHRYFPQLKVTGSLLLWNDDLPFDAPEMTSTPSCPLPAGCMTMFSDLFAAFKIREQFTAQLQVQLVQPLTPLYSIHQLNRVNRLGIDMARARLSTTRQTVRHDVTTAYIQAYQARDFLRIMIEAEALVNAHIQRVKQLFAAEMVRKAEILKVRVKAAEVAQNRIRAKAAVELAHANLARVIGLPIETRLTLTERFGDPPAPYPLTLAQCTSRALRQRQELRMTRIGKRQLRAGRAATLWQMVPTVAAVAQLEVNHGLGAFMPRTAFFVGAVLQWNFEWGRKIREADVMTAQLNRLNALETKARRGIPLEVKKLWLDLRVALASLRVTRAAVKAAEESHRIQVKRFSVREASTTDVLDAQMALTRARASHATALYKVYLAKAALDRATGVDK